MSAATFVHVPQSIAPRSRPGRFKRVEKSPPMHGEKAYEQLVLEAFDGPVLRLSKRLQLLEESDNRHIRRGDAHDLIAEIERELEARYAVKHPNKAYRAFVRYAAFAAGYAVLALIWCFIIGAR